MMKDGMHEERRGMSIKYQNDVILIVKAASFLGGRRPEHCEVKEEECYFVKCN